MMRKGRIEYPYPYNKMRSIKKEGRAGAKIKNLDPKDQTLTSPQRAVHAFR